jgi:hypothetical protein
VPRDLADVLHYFLPELDAGTETPDRAAARPRRSRIADGPSRGGSAERGVGLLPLSLLGVPIGDRDMVHAAYIWNLAIETARQGGASLIVAPERDRDGALWPAAGAGPFGCELVHCAADDVTELCRAAAALAEERRRHAPRGGIVFVRIPPAWLAESKASLEPLRWLLFFASPGRMALDAPFEHLKPLIERQPGLDVGVALQGFRRVGEARKAFDDLARRFDERFGTPLASYGLLVDDLDVYRGIATGQPIGHRDPEAPACRALRDVARLLYEDARSRVLG